MPTMPTSCAFRAAGPNPPGIPTNPRASPPYPRALWRASPRIPAHPRASPRSPGQPGRHPRASPRIPAQSGRHSGASGWHPRESPRIPANPRASPRIPAHPREFPGTLVASLGYLQGYQPYCIKPMLFDAPRILPASPSALVAFTHDPCALPAYFRAPQSILARP
jgi:hypothetical protein